MKSVRSSLKKRREFLKIFASTAFPGAWLSTSVLAESIHENHSKTEAKAALRAEVEREITSGLIHGAVLTSGTSQTRHETLCFGFAHGDGSHETAVPMRPESQFDVASITKTQTACALALLIAEGKVDPDAPFTDYLPEHTLRPCTVTVRDLAMHVGGFDSSNGFHGPDEAAFWRYLWEKKPVRPRLERFEYVCYDFILLGEIVHHVSGQRLDAFCSERIFKPLGMTHSEWGPTPTRPETVQVIATRRLGDISDFQAQAAPFPIGNAGLFTTAGDLALFCQQMLRRNLFPESCYKIQFIPGFEKGGARRSFGWDLCDARRPAGFSRSTIFHSGWSGQSLWIDPENDFFAVCLTNRFGDWEQAMQGRQRLGKLLLQIQTG